MFLIARRLLIALVLLLASPMGQAQNKIPSERDLETLVKTSLLSFNDANLTGNYAVFHAKLAKPFREQFPPDRLKETFKEFGEKHIDIDGVAVLKPTYTTPSSIDAEGKLLVRGFFPTEPTRVKFQLDFVPSDGQWKLIRINVRVDAPS
jgi:hypothetical protein